MLVLGKYKFKFGFEFLKEVNKKFKPINTGSISIKVGMENVMSVIFGQDIEGLIELLKLANKPEIDVATIADIAQLVEECEDIAQVFDEVLEELKTSNFTKSKTLEFLENMKPKQK